MAIAERTASINWQGDVQKGGGTISMESSGACGDLDISLPTRTEAPDGHTSPEELLAAAHAGCYAMALSLGLTEAGTPPESLDATAVATLDRDGDGFAITTIELSVKGKVPDIDASTFEAAAKDAEENCPVSKMMKGNVKIELEATLED